MGFCVAWSTEAIELLQRERIKKTKEEEEKNLLLHRENT